MTRWPPYHVKPGYSGTDDLPRVGDLVAYTCHSRGTVTLPVTSAVDQGGYTDYYLADCLGPPLFNVNHASGLANTHHCNGGDWEIVERKLKDKPEPTTKRVAVLAVFDDSVEVVGVYDTDTAVKLVTVEL